MRWSRLPLLCLWSLLCVGLTAQSLPNFNDAVDPADLTSIDITYQLDTVAAHRRPYSLANISQEFDTQNQVVLETFYQKSTQHQLLRLAQITIPLDHLYSMIEGLGKTYFRISDGTCTVILEYNNQATKPGQSFFRKECLL